MKNIHDWYEETYGKTALERHLKEHGWKYADKTQMTYMEAISWCIERYQKRIPLIISGGVLFGNFNALMAFPLYYILHYVIHFTHAQWKADKMKRQTCFYIVDITFVLCITIYLLLPSNSWFTVLKELPFILGCFALFLAFICSKR